MTDLLIAAGALFSLTGIIARSLSSHALLSLLEQRGKVANFNLAADYLLLHGVAICGVAILCHLFPEAKYHRVAWLFIIGSLCFQGSVLIKSFVAIHPFGFITPVGGFILMAGWGLLASTSLLYWNMTR